MRQKKLFLILALLCAVAQGAWADDGIHCSASDKGRVVCTDGSIYDNVSAAAADGKTAVAMIIYLDTENNKGLALALADEGQMTWSTAISTCSAKTPTVTGGTWKLASRDEWNTMITAAGSYTALRDGFSSVGGTNLQSDPYWSSTVSYDNLAFNYGFRYGSWYSEHMSFDYYVRACLALDFTAPDTGVWADWPTQGAGTVDDPYIISSADDWNKFAHNVTIGRNYSGKYVKLTSDISVTTMAGGYQDESNYQPLSGTFDGDGHKLTLNVSNQSRFAAPFKCVSGATIKNLRTAGTISGTGNSDGKLLAGLVGVSFGNTTISGCVSSVTLATDFGEDAALAGLVAGTKGGSLTIEGCVFDGEMLGTTNTRCAGIVGYEYGGTTTTITNSLFAPATLTVSIANDGYTKTFTRDPDATITNCYYTQVLGTEQGTQAYAMATAPANLGNLVQDYGMVKAYANGLLFGGMYYVDLSTSNGEDNGDAVYTQTQTTYTLTVKDGTEDAVRWSADPNPAGEGQSVTIKYNGKKKVKIVTAVQKNLRPLAEATTADLGKIAGADGNIYNTKAAAEAAYTQAVAMIAYVGSETDNAAYKHGLAIALADEGKMNWSTAKSTCEGKSAVTNAAWLLPSLEQWKAMFRANGGEGSYTGLNTALATAGGDSSKLQETDWDSNWGYWSSTPNAKDYAWRVDLYGGAAHWGDGAMGWGVPRVRACLAF